jgi:hypothetical protein
MATLEGKKIKDTFKSLLKVNNNGELNETLQEITDGDGNGSGVLINNTGDVRVQGTLEFANLKDSGENITISKLVDEADGIASNDNDTSIPTTAAVKDYVDTNVTAQDLDFSGDSGIGAVDLDSQLLNIVGTNGAVTTASGQTITIDTSSLDTRLTTAEADIDTNTADIATEEAARIAADNTLQTNIDSEEAARISADNTLQANINTEATTRATADTTLQSNIDAEAATRLSNDTTLQSNIDTEEAARIAADSTLQSNIDSEAATRLANDNTLQSNIDSEETARIAADSNLQSQVTSNDGDITALDGRLITAETNISSNDTDISNLQSNKQDISEKGQANGYAPLDSGAKISEAYLPDSIVGQLEYQGTWDASTDTPTLPAASTVKGHYYVTSVAGTYETIDYAIGDWVISNGTAWEKVDNTDAVTTVFGRLGAIVANEADYSAFYPLISDLDAEETARIAADNTLQSNIDSEASTRAAADTTLQGNIDTEETARIAGDANLQTQIDTINLDNVDGSGTANYIPKWTDADTIGNSVIYDNGTNVGIGTSSPATKLHTFASNPTSRTTFRGDAATFVGTGINIAGGAGDLGIHFADNSTIERAGIYATAGSEMYIRTANTERMRIASNGNVGIGESSPETLLHISDSVNPPVLRLDYDKEITTWTPEETITELQSFIGDSSGIGKRVVTNIKAINENSGSTAAGALAFFTSATNSNVTERMRITSSGKVGIGTSSPAHNLTIEAPVDAILHLKGSDLGRLFFGDAAANGAGRIQYYHIDDSMQFYTNSAERMRIISNGNVGIGTASPATKLEVNSGGDNNVALFESTDQNAIVTIKDSFAKTDLRQNVGTFKIEVDPDDVGGASSLIVEIDGSEKLRVLNSGGITFNGDTAADNALDDYEEGTWSPVYQPSAGSFATMTMEIITAKYTKIGRMVTVFADIRTDDVDVTGGSGQVRVGGLPFTVVSSGGGIAIGLSLNFVVSPDSGYFQSTTTQIRLRDTDATADFVVGGLTEGTSADQNRIMFQGTYFVS